MFPFANMLATGDQDAIYVGGYVFPYPGGTVPAPAFAALGASAGDFAIYVSLNSGGGLNEPGWTSLGSDGAFQHFYKVLTAADLSIRMRGPVGTMLLVYRGPIISYAIVSRVGGGPPGTGFVKHRAHVGLVAVGNNYPTDREGQQAVAVGPPVFALRLISDDGWNDIAAHDRLSPPNPTYVDGTRFSLTSGAATILELRSE